MTNRNFTRVNYSAAAAIQYGNDQIMCNTGNLSIHGMYLKTESDLPVNESVHVTVYNSNQSSFNVHAHIVRKEAHGVGLQINTLSANAFAQLRDIVSEKCNDRGKVITETLSMLKCIH